jgi:hypothetical protein
MGHIRAWPQDGGDTSPPNHVTVQSGPHRRTRLPPKNCGPEHWSLSACALAVRGAPRAVGVCGTAYSHAAGEP